MEWNRRFSACLQLNSMSNYFDREVKRRGFVVQRWDFREKEKMEIENEKKNRAGVNIAVHFFLLPVSSTISTR